MSGLSSTQPATGIHVLSRSEIASADAYARWDDPDRIAPIEPAKLRTMLENPLNGPDSEPAQIIGTVGYRVVGRMDLVAGELRVNGRPQRIYYSSNLFVPEAQRKSLMGVMLILKSQSLHHTVAAFGPSQMARQVYEKLKWSDIELPRYILIRNSRPVVQRYYGDRVGLGALSMLANGALGAHRGVMGWWNARRLKRFDCRQAQRMPADMDEQLAQQTVAVACHRSSAWINWLLAHSFSDDPRNAQLLFLVHDHAGRTVAYFLLKVRFHETATHRQFRNLLLGSLQDWIIFDPQALEFHDIALLAVRELVRRKVDAVEVVTPTVQAAQPLQRLGFARVGSMHMMFRGVAPSPLADPALRKPENWFIRPGDGENFFV